MQIHTRHSGVATCLLQKVTRIDPFHDKQTSVFNDKKYTLNDRICWSFVVLAKTSNIRTCDKASNDLNFTTCTQLQEWLHKVDNRSNILFNCHHASWIPVIKDERQIHQFQDFRILFNCLFTRWRIYIHVLLSVRTIGHLPETFWSVQPYPTMCERVQLCARVFDRVRACSIVCERVQLCASAFDCVQPCVTVLICQNGLLWKRHISTYMCIFVC